LTSHPILGKLSYVKSYNYLNGGSSSKSKNHLLQRKQWNPPETKENKGAAAEGMQATGPASSQQ
jgi:hypothetical protein